MFGYAWQTGLKIPVTGSWTGVIRTSSEAAVLVMAKMLLREHLVGSAEVVC